MPAAMPIEVDRGNADKFIDKPFMLLHPASAGSGTVIVSSMLKDGTPISQEVPAATIYIAYTTFTGTVEDGNLSSNILLAKSEDYGDTWTTTEITNSSCKKSAMDFRSSSLSSTTSILLLVSSVA